MGVPRYCDNRSTLLKREVAILRTESEPGMDFGNLYAVNTLTPTEMRTRMTIDPVDQNDEVERRMEQDVDIGDPNSLWFRPLRNFLVTGKPPTRTTMVLLQHPRKTAPVFAVSRTTKDRVVLWPIPSSSPVLSLKPGSIPEFDHVTLELSSGRIHATSVKLSGKRKQFDSSDFNKAQSWKLFPLEGTGCSLFATLCVKIKTLMAQDSILQRRDRIPTTDRERRIEVLTQYSQQLQTTSIPIQQTDLSTDCGFCWILLQTDRAVAPQLTADSFPYCGVDEAIEGWPAGFPTVISARMADIDDQTRLVIAVTCPPGISKQEVLVGLPRSLARQ